MPRIQSEFHNDAAQVPFDFSEVLAAIAPRKLLVCAAESDADFDVSGVRDVIAAARPVYELYQVGDQLKAHYYPARTPSRPTLARSPSSGWTTR